MSSFFYNYQDFNVFNLLHLQDFNVFSFLHLQRLQCLQSFTFLKTSMSFVFCAFKDYNVFCFMIPRLQCLLLYDFKDYNVFSLLRFQRLQCLQSFIFSKTSMSFIFYAFKDYNVFWFVIPRLECFLLYDFKDYNVFSLLHFQRLQCLHSFTFSKTTMSSIFLHFQRLQCV